MKLKVREIEIEGTPDEIAQAGYAELLAGRAAQNGGSATEAAAPTSDSGASEFSPEITQFLDMRVPRSIRPTAEAIIREILSWDSIRTAIGPGIPGGRYIRFHRRGSNVGTFLYLNPNKANFRLQGSAAEGRRYAIAREVQDTNPHQVMIHLDEPDALSEVLELARQAYEEAA